MTEAFWERDEYGENMQMRDDMDHFFIRFSQWKKPAPVFEKAWKPLCDVYECPDHFSVIVELAGVEVEKVGVTLHDRVLTIRGHRRQFRPSEINATYLLEINYGEFERVLELPLDIDSDATRAIYRGGFLEIVIPKLKRSNPRGVDIRSE